MIRRFLAIALFAIGTTSSRAQPSLPSSFQAKTIHSPEGADIFVRSGGSGPVVVLLHGYAENSDSWAPLAADLMKDHTVIAPDLRGIGRSSKPNPSAAVIAAAVLFSAAHIPGLLLTVGTLAWGIVSCTLFLRTLYALGLVHGILGLCMAISVPDAVTHHIMVGLGYLHYLH